jgi:hypothetical protein
VSAPTPTIPAVAVKVVGTARRRTFGRPTVLDVAR